MMQALQGGYVEPGPGGDPIRNPAVLPTGKNIHALDPQSIPTQAALKSARVVVERSVHFGVNILHLFTEHSETDLEITHRAILYNIMPVLMHEQFQGIMNILA